MSSESDCDFCINSDSNSMKLRMLGRDMSSLYPYLFLRKRLVHVYKNSAKGNAGL